MTSLKSIQLYSAFERPSLLNSFDDDHLDCEMDDCDLDLMLNQQMCIDNEEEDIQYLPKHYTNAKSQQKLTQPKHVVSSSSSVASFKCPMHQFLSTLRKEKTMSSFDHIKSHGAKENVMSKTTLQFDLVSDGAAISSPARMKFSVSQKKLNRWDSSGTSRNRLNQPIGTASRRSQDTIPTLPGQNRYYEVSDLKNSTWDDTTCNNNIKDRSSSSRMTALKASSLHMNKHNASRSNKNALFSLTSRSSSIAPSQSTTASSHFVRRDSNNDSAPSLPRRR